MMKIAIANDHRGYKLKTYLEQELTNEGYDVINLGTDSEESVDYPDFAFKLGEKIVNKEADFGVAICGSGIGISIACNKVKGIRCAKVNNLEEVIATRNDNDSNIIALGEKMPKEKAKNLVIKFIETPWSQEEKHHRRVEKIINYEEKHE